MSVVLGALVLAVAVSGVLPVRGEEGSDPVNAETPAPAWSASLTVGQSGSDTSSLTVWGYSAFAAGGLGELSEDAFSSGDQTIEVKVVLLQSGHLLLSLLPEPADGFVLDVDGTGFASADATVNRNDTLIAYLWTDSELSWAQDDAVALSLSRVEAEGASAELGDEEKSQKAETVVVDVTPPPTPVAPPARPIGLSTSATPGSVSLTWDDPADAAITHYQVFRRDTSIHVIGEFITLEENTGSSDTTYADESVEPERKYVYRVKAVNAAGASQWSSFSSATTLPAPDPPPAAEDLAPTGLTATLVEGGGVTLTWTAPAEDSGSVSGYEILRAVGEGELTTLVADTGSTATTYTDATATEAGETYAYQVKAIRGEERSQASGEAQVQTPHEAVDLAPSNLTTTLVKDGGVSLSWSAPAEDAASVTGYEILRTTGEGALTTLAADTGNTATAYTDVTATEAGETYTYEVKAIRGEDRSQASGQAQVQLPRDAVDLAPTGLTATLPEGGGVTVSWSAPAEDSGSVTGYEILRAVGEGALTTLVADTESTDTTYTDATATEAGETYAYQVKAIRDGVRSQASAEASVTPPAATVSICEFDAGGSDLPADTSTACALEVGGSVRGERGAAGDVDWVRVELQALATYQFDMRGKSTGEWQLVDGAPAFVSVGTLEDPRLLGIYDASGALVAGTDSELAGTGKDSRIASFSPDADGVYYISASAEGGWTGTYELSVTVTAGTHVEDLSLLAPTGLTAALADGGGVSLSWTAPAEGADSVSGYEILRAVGDGALTTLVSDTASTTMTYTDATATATGETYAYQVKAIRGEDRSRASGEASVQVPHDAVDLAPAGLAATLADGGGATLSWSAPAEDADSVTGYEILRAVGDGEPVTLVADTGNTTTTYGDATATEAGETYAYQVKAIRGEERSQASGRVQVQLPHDPVDLAPSGLTATFADGGGYTLTWTAPAEDADSVDGYEILRAAGEGALTTLVADTQSTATAYTDASASQPGTSYAYGVIALRGGVKSQQSNEASVDLPVRGGVQVACLATDTACSGSGPADLAVTETAAGLLLSWDPPPEPTGDSVETEVLQYQIMRSPGNDDYALVTCVDADARSYLDATAEAGGQYRYQVRAIYFVNEACASLRDIDVDLTLDGTAYKPVSGLWSDGTTLWASDRRQHRILAFRLSDGAYDSARDIVAENGSNPRGLWGRDGTLWAATESGSGSTPITLDGFSLADDSAFGSRTARLTLGPKADDTGAPTEGYGLWGDEDTFWTLGVGSDSLFAYDWADSGTLTRNTTKELRALSSWASIATSMWGDGTTMWISTQLSGSFRKVAAISWPAGTADTSRDIALRSGRTAGGMWSDGEIIWIASGNDDLHAYPLSDKRQHSAWARSNRPAVVTVTPTTAVVAGAGTLSPRVKVSDPENDSLTYAWTSTAGSFADDEIAGATWTAAAATTADQTVTLTLTVTDEHDETATATVVVTVPASTSGSPTVSVAAVPAIVDGGADVTLDGTASDPQTTETLTYAWTSSGGGTFDASTSTAVDTTWTAPAATLAEQRITLTLTATDDNPSPNSATSTVVVIVRADRAPLVEVSPTAAILSGVAPELSLETTATDHETDSDDLTYAWSSDGGGTFADAAAASTTWTAPAASTTDQEITLTLTVTDAAGNAVTAAAAITLRASRPPAVTVTPSEESIDGGGTLTLEATAVDPEGDRLTYAWSSDSGGTFADAAALETSWTAPDAMADLDVALTLTVTDAVGNSTAVTVVITLHGSSGPGPTNVVLSEVGSGLQLSWEPPPAPTLANAETEVLQYQIMRSPGDDDYALMACVGADARNYIDVTAEAGGQYRHRVRAIYFVNEACASLRDIDVDLTLGGTEYQPVDGLWSDGATLWASDNGEGRILAFRLSDGLYDGARDIVTDSGAQPRGLWGRDGTLWALTQSGPRATPNTLDGFSLADSTFGDRTARLTLGPTSGQSDAPKAGHGLWADEDTFWIAALGSSTLHAYDWADSGTLTRNTAKEVSPDISVANTAVSMWGDGTTMWIATQHSASNGAVAAINWPAGTVDTSRDIALRASHGKVGGMWSDGEIIWIASGNDDLYVYPLSNQRQHSAWARPNRPPVVTVSPATAVVAGAGSLSPKVNATDPDGDDLTYAWTSSNSSTFDDHEIAGATWTAPAATASDQEITLTLTVTDARSATATATVVVTVPSTTSGSPTVSVTAAPAIVDGGADVTLDGTAADPQGDTLAYAWSSSSSGGTFDASTSTTPDTTWTAPAATLAEQNITLTLTATDDSSDSNSAASTAVVVVRPNRAPLVEVSPAAAIVSGVAPEVSLEATVTDHETDNDDLTYAWSSDGGGTFADAAAASTTWTAPAGTLADQEITLTLTVTDAAGNTVSAEVAITRRANRPPTVTVTPGEDSIVGGRELTLDATADDPEGDSLTYAWSSDIGTFGEAAALDTTWTAPDAVSDEEATLTLTVTDAIGNSTSVTVVITVLSNVPPIGPLNVVCAADDAECSGPGPTNVALSRVASGLELSWEPPPAPTAEGAETEVHQYQILRAAGGTDFRVLACEPVESRSYLNSGTEPDGHYRYLVRAIYFANDACAALRDIDVDVTIAGTDYEPVDGLWSDGTTLWAGDHAEDRILAFNLADGARNSGKDIVTDPGAQPRGLWGRAGTLWAVTSSGSGATPTTLDGFSLAEGSAFGDRTARVTLGPTSGQSDAPQAGFGLWGDDDRFWVVSSDTALFAYDWATTGTLARDTAQEVSPTVPDPTTITALWGDGATMWIATETSHDTRTLYAVDWPAGTRNQDREITLRSAQGIPRGLWSDGELIWVSSGRDDLYAYPLGQQRQHSAWSPPNLPPAVAAPAAATVSGGQALSLRGSAVDQEGDTLTVAWTSSGGGAFADAASLATTWTAPAATAADQSVTLTLTVTDEAGGSAMASMVVTVLANQSPLVSASPATASVAGGEALALGGEANDPEGDGLTFAWTSGGGGTFDDASDPNAIWTAPAATANAQNITLTLTATDDGAGTLAGTAQVAVTVPQAGSQAPTASATANTAIVAGGATVILDGTAADPQDDTLSYAWTSDGGGTFEDDDALDAFWTAPAATAESQPITLTLTATDTGSNSGTATLTVTVLPSLPLTLTVSPMMAGVGAGGSLSLDAAVQAQDPESLTYAWTGDGGGTFADAAALDTTWTAPASVLATTEVTLTLTVTDAAGAGASASVAVSVWPGQPPSVTARADRAVVQGLETVSLTGTASDDAPESLTYAWRSDGGGEFADAAAQDTTWTAPAARGTARNITLTLTVTNATGASASAHVNITVPGRARPSVALRPSQTLTLTGGEVVSLDAGVGAPPDSELTYKWKSAGGGVLIGDTDELQGSWKAPEADADADQRVTLGLTATDQYGASATAKTDVTIWAKDGQPRTTAVTVPATWSLIPAGLGPGDSFRLLFVSDSLRRGNSSNIADYNTFVQKDAAAGHAAIQSYSSDFRVVGCTRAVDAVDNTAMTGRGVPVYWLNGAKIADNYFDFYDGAWELARVGALPGGAAYAFHEKTARSLQEVYVGCDFDGTGDGWELGGEGNFVRIARPGRPEFVGLHGGGFIGGGSIQTSVRRFYGMSPVFTVAGVGTPRVEPDPGVAREIFSNSPLVPARVDVGDRFRLLLFTRDNLHAVRTTAADIDDYNAYIENLVDEGYEHIRPFSAGFRVVGATTTTTLADNVDLHVTPENAGIEIYWLPSGDNPRGTGFDLHSQNGMPRGIWGNDETIWVVNNGSGAGDKIFAYNRADGSRDASNDFDTLNAADNNSPTGICSDGTTMFVTDNTDSKVYAYTMSNKSRDNTQDIDLHMSNSMPEGLWCDANTVWVAEDDTAPHNDIFAYNRANGNRNTAVDFPGIDRQIGKSPAVYLNANPRGIYSDGVTMFVVDDEDQRVYAWRMSNQSWDPLKDINLDDENTDPEGLWFDGRTLWVVDDADDKLYVYDLPGARQAQRDKTAVGGERVARSYADFLDGSWGHESSGIRVDGSTHAFDGARVIVATGVCFSGRRCAAVENVDAGDGDIYTGNFTLGGVVVAAGVPNRATGDPLYGTIIRYDRAYAPWDPTKIIERPPTARYYGISPVFKVVECPPGALLCATIGAKGFSTSDGARVGYDQAQAKGVFSPRPTFTSRGTQYTVLRLESFGSGTIRLVLDKALPASTTGVPNTLQIGSERTSFSLESDVDITPGPGGEEIYTWENTGVEWSPQQTVNIILGSISTVVPHDWALKPADLTIGEAFRLLFLTSTTRDATSSDIADYNAFVETAAAAGHADIQAYSGGFRGVASTADDDARDNTATTATGVRIYWLGGNKVADNYADFYDGTWDDESNVTDESGSAYTSLGTPEVVWTGSNDDGTEAASEGLGASVPLSGWLNSPSSSTANPLDAGDTNANTNTYPLYALSEVFVVGAAPVVRVDVPASWLHWPSGARADDEFRLLFVTHQSRDATSTTINDYNRFVQDEAAAPYSERLIRKAAPHFRAVVSTATVDARDNTGMTGRGVPIYWVDGGWDENGDEPGKVADDYADFYDGDWDTQEQGAYVFGNLARWSSNTRIWTGSSRDGRGLTGSTMGSDTVGYGVPGGEVKQGTGFSLHNSNGDPEGVWGNETTIWVANDGTGTGNKIFAYKRSDGTSDSDQDFETLNAASNNEPRGICSDGTTMFVTDSEDDKVYAYKLSDMSHDGDKDITLHSDNADATGLWCDAATIWVANDGTGTGNKIFAYKRSDGTSDSDQDFETLNAASNNKPRGIWSDGTTMFVTDSEDDKVYAYKLSDMSHDGDKDITLHNSNADPEGLWFDGRVLWVVDNADDQLYAYEVPGPLLGGAFPDPNTEIRPLYGISPVFTVAGGRSARPRNVVKTESGGTVTLTWDKPRHDGGYDLAEYKIYWRKVRPSLVMEAAAFQPTGMNNHVGYSASRSESSLSPTTFEYAGVTYTVTKLANVLRQGPYFPDLDVTLTPIPPASVRAQLHLTFQPEGTPLALSNATVTTSGTSATFTWGRVGVPLNRGSTAQFAWTNSQGERFYDDLEAQVDGDTTTWEHTGGADSHYWITAVTVAGESGRTRPCLQGTGTVCE